MCCGHRIIKWFQSTWTTTRLIHAAPAELVWCLFQVTNRPTVLAMVILRLTGQWLMDTTSWFGRNVQATDRVGFTRLRSIALMAQVTMRQRRLQSMYHSTTVWLLRSRDQ